MIATIAILWHAMSGNFSRHEAKLFSVYLKMGYILNIDNADFLHALYLQKG